MERDFLGLGPKNILQVKEETHDVSKDNSVSMRSPMQWSFSNNVSAAPQYLSFKNTAGDDKPRNNVHDPVASSGFMTISTSDAFDSNQKLYSGIVQKNMIVDKQGINQYGVTNYAVQHIDAYPVNCAPEMRMFPVSHQHKQAISVSVTSTPALQSHFAPTGHNVVASSINSTPLGGVPIITPLSVIPGSSSVIGTTELRSVPKLSAKLAQLTIFYEGSVCVYDDVTPEKAQAIMSLAGHGVSAVAPNMTLSTATAQVPMTRSCTTDGYAGNKTQTVTRSSAPLQAPIIKPCVVDGYAGTKNQTASPCSGLPSPISVTSSSTNELTMAKQAGTSLTSSSQPEAPKKAVGSIGHTCGNLGPAVALPQARKASLARFLEKRKERVTSSSPYNLNKKSLEQEASEGVSLSMNCSSSISSPRNLAVKGGH